MTLLELFSTAVTAGAKGNAALTSALLRFIGSRSFLTLDEMLVEATTTGILARNVAGRGAAIAALGRATATRPGIVGGFQVNLGENIAQGAWSNVLTRIAQAGMHVLEDFRVGKDALMKAAFSRAFQTPGMRTLVVQVGNRGVPLRLHPVITRDGQLAMLIEKQHFGLAPNMPENVDFVRAVFKVLETQKGWIENVQFTDDFYKVAMTLGGRVR